MSKSSEIISLTKSIETNCYTQGVKLPDILRQCKSLAHKLDYLPLKNWADYELGGYSDNTQLPPYRIFKNVPLFGNLLANHYGGLLTIKQQPLTLKQDFIENLSDISGYRDLRKIRSYDQAESLRGIGSGNAL